MIDEWAGIEAAERQLDVLIERRAKGNKEANADALYWREKDTRYRDAVRLLNAKSWASYYGGLALASHDAAARYAQKRDEARELVRKLEAKQNKLEKRTA